MKSKNLGEKRRINLVLWTAGCLVAGAICPQQINAQVDKFYGEPVRLKGNAIYFTSWKYVFQGAFSWEIQQGGTVTDGQNEHPQELQGDGGKLAKFKMVNMPRGIRLVAQPARKVPSPPGQMTAQIFDEGKYKTWYGVSPCSEPELFSAKDKISPGSNSHIAYAESSDGRTWEKPILGLLEYAGNKNNNIVFRGDVNGLTRGYSNGCVFVDPSSKDERYKMFYRAIVTAEEWEAFAKKYPDEIDTKTRRADNRSVLGMFGAVSPDGLHWQSLPEPLLIYHADTVNTCYYDVDLKKYVAYIRTWQVDERVRRGEPDDDAGWVAVGRRTIGRAVSDDFRHFSKPETIIATGTDQPPSHVWYSNCKTTLPGCPDNHIMFPWLWEMESDGGNTWLLSSADGLAWSMVPGGPVLVTGNPGSADGAHIGCGGNLLEYPDSIWGIPYGGSPIPHKYPGRDIQLRKGLFPGVEGVGGLATWPKGRLVALQCDEEGEFATVAIMPTTERVRLNAVIKPTGYIKVAVRLTDGKRWLADREFDQTDPMVGDSLEFPLRWNGQDNIGHNGEPIRLKFQMRQAKLFGVEFY
jgi:hypothetical protein